MAYVNNMTDTFIYYNQLFISFARRHKTTDNCGIRNS